MATNTKDKKDKRHNYKLLLLLCMEDQVKQVIIKSGKVIWREGVEAISKRLANKIWVDIKDQFDEIPLNQFKTLERMHELHEIFFTFLLKKWNSAETVLLMMELNLPLIDNIITLTFIEEAAKLKKRAQRNACSKSTTTNTSRSDLGITKHIKEKMKNNLQIVWESV